ncbi:MAG TPA: DUF488 family protein [Lapillicoccus sp.]|nr:DUF488 family protein [Lapillicoccus sp.]
MSIRVVRLGTPRAPDEGMRIGTVRRPPRGVPKEEFASRDFYDVWLPELAPSQELVRQAQRAETDREWQRFVHAYRREMSRPEVRHVIDVLAALSHRTQLAVGCYCADDSRCHRGVLKQLLVDAGADVG